MKLEIKQAIEEYKKGDISLAKVAGKYQIDRSHLSNVLKSLNIKIINKQNQVRVNEYVFDIIDTEEKAYWLGFLFADGNVSSKGNKIELSLSSTDIEHLEKFKEFLNYNGNLKEYNTNFIKRKRCRLIFSSKHMHTTLCKCGCIPKKSLILQFPKVELFKESRYIKDFIRGYVDGDGCLTYQDKQHKIPNISILGTFSFLQEAIKYLPKM